MAEIYKPGTPLRFKDEVCWMGWNGHTVHQKAGQFCDQKRWDDNVGWKTSFELEPSAFKPVRTKPLYNFMVQPDSYLDYLVSRPKMGTDPEFFVSHQGVPVGAFQLLPAKNEVGDQHPFWDGFQAEVRMYAHTCHTEMMRLELAPSIRSFKLLHNLEIRPTPVWRVPDELLLGAPEHFVMLGCDPSLNAYQMRGRRVDNYRELKWRFAGGHIHFNLSKKADKKDEKLILSIVKALDTFLAIPCVCLFQNYDKPIRRKYYGLAGEFRLPPHGLEYRSLSNGWCLHPRSSQLVLDMARWVFQLGYLGWAKYLQATPQRDVVEIVNWHDVAAAKQFMDVHRQMYTDWAQHRYGGSGWFWRAIDKGIEAALPEFGKDVHKDWVLAEGLHAHSNFDAWTWKGLEAQPQ